MMRVYFMQMGNGPIKVGISRDPSKRRKQIGELLPYRLKILATVPGNRDLERRIHYALGEYRTRGEWFAPDAEVRGLAIIAAAKGLPAVMRWLEQKEAAILAAPEVPVNPTDFEDDVRALIALAFRRANGRFGAERVAAAVGKSSDVVRSYAKGARPRSFHDHSRAQSSRNSPSSGC